MKIFLLIAVLLAMAGTASATSEYGSIGFHRGATGPGTEDYGCTGQPPAGCYDVDADSQWGVFSNDDAERPFVNACLQGNEPNEPPAPGSNTGAWYRDGQSSYGASGGLGVCATAGEFIGFTLLGGQGAWLGQDGVGTGHNENVFVGGEEAHAELGENGGSQSTVVGAWSYLHSDASGTCAYSNLGTPNGGISAGPFCD